MDWHKKWSDDFRDIYHLNFYKNGLLKNPLYLLELIKKRMANLI